MGPSLKDRLQRQKPWAILGMPRKRYEASRPWNGFGDRARFEELLRALGEQPGLVQGLLDEARAEALVEEIFGKDACAD